jgi:hypothetical protein
VSAELVLIWLSLSQPGSGAAIAERLPVVAHRGGPVVTRPTVATLTFAGDDPARVSRLEAFGRWVGGSAWWRAVTAGYCVGPECIRPARPGPTLRLDRRLNAVVRDVDVERLLEEEASRAPSRLGPDTVLLVYLPRGVRLHDAAHARYCGGGPRAFHRMLQAGGRSFPFAVVAACGDDDEATATASHELLEAVTNPDPGRPGFRLPPGSHALAFAASGAEPADPCALLNLDRHRTREHGFLLQRAWSNAAAARGQDPCVPAVEERPYVALVPRRPVLALARDTRSATLEVAASADRPHGGWEVAAIDLGARGGRPPTLEARLDRSRVAPGDVAVLTVAAAGLRPGETGVVGLVSRVAGHEHVWPVAVTLP